MKINAPAGIALAATLAVSLAGCTQFPELDRAIPASELQGPYPPLVPVESLLAQTDDPRITETDQAALEARAAALRTRAARLRDR